jgi:DNA-binding CsgD family transcriptional regulator
VTPTPLRGRDGELAVIGDRLAGARGGHGAVLFVGGPAGFGKTRLLSEAAAMAGRGGFRVGAGAVAPSDQVVPMGALLAALFDGREPLADPSARRRLPYLPEQRYRLLDELESLVGEAALASPTLICIDDMCGRDSGTLMALRTLPPRLADLPVVWLVAFREGQAGPQLQSVVESLNEVGAHTLMLGSLGADAVAQVAADIIGAVPGPSVLDQAARAHGSPFLLAELLRGLKEEALVRIESGRATLVDERLPARVTDSMRRRLSLMSGPARQAALVASVLGRRFSFDHLSAMLGEPASALLAPVGELVRADLLADDDDLLTYRHDLIREAVRDTLPPTALRALQRQAVQAMLAAGSAPLEVATLLADAAQPGDQDAVRTLREAAGALGSTDPGAAADLSRRALELAAPENPLRGRLVGETALFLHAAGRIEEGKAFADQALGQVLSPRQEAEVRLSIAGMMAVSPDERARAGHRALTIPGLPDDLRARHLVRLVHNLVVAGDLPGARKLLSEARHAVRSAGDESAVSTLGFAEALLGYMAGRFGPTLAKIEAVSRARGQLSEPAREVMAARLHVEVLAALDRYDESLRLSTDGLAAGQRDHQRWAVRVWEGQRGRQLLQAGRIADAAAALEGNVVPPGKQTPVAVLDAVFAVALGRAAIHAGDEPQVRSCAAIARELLATGPPSVRRHGAWLLALVATWEGDPVAARAHLSDMGEDERLSVVPMFPLDVTDEVPLMRIALAAGDSELASTAATNARERARLNPGIASIAGTAAHAEGLMMDDIEHLSSAVKWFEDSPRPLALASALEDAGKAFARRGDREQGVALLGRALELYAHGGASWDAGRVRRRLRALGVRWRVTTDAKPRYGWSGLTKSELDVVRLVAQGLTNRQTAERLFLSPHTVSNHLRHAFAKLGITSRVELARLAATHESAAGRTGT